MAKHITCKNCKKKQEQSRAVLKPDTKGVWFCSDKCLQEELNKGKTTWQLIMDKVQSLYGEEANYPFICQQLNFLKSQYNFTDEGILLTLDYYLDVAEKFFDTNFGLQGVLCNYYKKAEDYWIYLQDMEEDVESFDFTQTVKTFTPRKKTKIKKTLSDY